MQGGDIPDLNHVPPISGLPEHARLYLQARLLKVEFPAGQLLIEAGKRGQFFGLVVRGSVGLEGPHGQRRVESGQTFGEGMLRYNTPASYTATTLAPTTLWVLTRADWRAARKLPPPETAPAAAAALETTLPAPLPAPAEKAARPSRRMWGAAVFVALLMALLILGPTLLPRANQALTRTTINAGRPDLAVRYLRFSARWQPDPAQRYTELGDLLHTQGDLTGAAAAYAGALAYDTGFAEAHNDLGVLLLERGEYEDARRHFQAALELNPGNAGLYQNLGAAALAAGDGDDAMQALRLAFELDPSLLDAQAAWAGLALEKGYAQEARAAWETVLAAEPGHPLANQGLGALAVLEDEPSTALPYLENARRSAPADPASRYYLGLALTALDRPSEAAAEFAFVVKESRDPDLVALAAAHLFTLKSQEEAPILHK